MSNGKRYILYNEPFRAYIEGMMKKRHCTWHKLLDGLCKAEEWDEYCNDDKPMSILLTERIMERLGCYIGNYDYLVFSGEYAGWEKRMQILFAIEDGDIDKAKRMLADYNAGRDKLARQFRLVMKAQIMKCEGADLKETAALYKSAARLTIPGSVDATLDECMLSVQEINILLEYYHAYSGMQTKCNKAYRKCFDRIRAVVRYVEEARWDEMMVARIYPKAVFYLSGMEDRYPKSNEKTMHDSFEEIMCDLDGLKARMVKCDRAIDSLRKTHRSYYFAEITDIRIDIHNRMKKILADGFLEESGYNKQADNLAEMGKILEYVEGLTGVCRYMRTDTYMYIEMSVYRMESAISSRRKAMGMSQADLAEDICDTKTVGRLERGQCVPRGYILYDILKKVKLYSDFVMESVIAFSSDEWERVWRINNFIMRGDVNRAEHELDYLKQNLDTYYERNRQTIHRLECYIKMHRKQLTQDEYISQLKRIMGYTMDYNVAVTNDSLYLTIDELLLIQNIERMGQGGEETKKLEDMCHMYETLRPELHISSYELYGSGIASYYGNIGNYDESDKLFFMVIKADAVTRRLKYIARCLYGIWWNADAQGKSTKEEKKAALKRCIGISEFIDEKRLTKIFRKMLEG